jgi:outer membrane protein
MRSLSRWARRTIALFLVFWVGSLSGYASQDGDAEVNRDELPQFRRNGQLHLALDNCLGLALKRNHDVLLTSEALVQASEDVTRARSAILPFLGAEASYIRFDEPLTFSFGPQTFTFMDKDIYRAGIVVKQPIFTGGKLIAGYKAAKYTRDARIPEKESIEEEIVFQVTRAYWTAQVAEAFQKVAAEGVHLLETHEHDVAILVREGAIPEIDLLRTRTELANAQKQLNVAENALDLGLSALKNLLVIDLEEPLVLSDCLGRPPRPVGDLSTFTRLAMSHRPEIASLQLQLEAARQAVKAAKGEYLPTIGLEGRYEYIEGDVRDLEGGDHWTLGLGAEMPLWNWNRTRANVGKAKSQLEQVNIQLQKMENQIRLGVRQAFLNLGKAEKNIEAAEASLEAAREAYRLASVSYQAGEGTNTEVLDARTALTRAEANHAQALFEYNVALAALERAVGPTVTDQTKGPTK